MQIPYRGASSESRAGWSSNLVHLLAQHLMYLAYRLSSSHRLDVQSKHCAVYYGVSRMETARITLRPFSSPTRITAC